MGPGSLAVEAGLSVQASGPDDENLRSRLLHSALKGAMLMEGGY
jgi:hypothetical protein